jgi:glycosyltransferase involved in cell wall biosynthesis
MRDPEILRVALLAGTLGQGGAEKQLVYMARALRGRGVDVRVFALTRDEHFEPHLRRAGVPVHWVGRRAHPLWRIASMRSALRAFAPHIVQSMHFYVNLYAMLGTPHSSPLVLGSLRSDVWHELESNRVFGHWLLRRPMALLTNSETARRNAAALGVPASRIAVVPNVLDLGEFQADTTSELPAPIRSGGVVISVARFVSPKRLERFITVLALVRRQLPDVSGWLVGDGPDRQRLIDHARTLGLLPDGVRFLGPRDDIPALLKQADVLLLTSEHEGFPNVLLEAMAAGLPVVTTDAGDAGVVVEHGVTGYVVQEGGEPALAARLLAVLGSPSSRRAMGLAARRRVERGYTPGGLADRLLDAYAALADRCGRTSILTPIGHHRAGAVRQAGCA